jgi:hypothetical protein
MLDTQPVSFSAAMSNCTNATTQIVGAGGTLVASVVVTDPFVPFAGGVRSCTAPGSCVAALGRTDGTNVFLLGSPISFVAPPPDETDPAITITQPSDGGEYILNAVTAADYSCSDDVELASCTGPVPSGSPFDTSTPGVHTFQVDASDAVVNTSSSSATYSVRYASGPCLDDEGRTILGAVDPDGSSVFKQNETITLRFRVCDANGVSIGTAGVVTGDGTAQLVPAESLLAASAKPPKNPPNAPTPFTWNATDQQWVATLDLKHHEKDNTYAYTIPLNDGTAIQVTFSLK